MNFSSTELHQSMAQPDIADFTRSIPPRLPIVSQRVGETLNLLATSKRGSWSIHESVPGGTAAERQAGAAWVSHRYGVPVDPSRLMLTNGTQGALLLLFERLVGRDGILATEALTYTPLDKLAARANIRIEGVALDEEGLVPESFEAICRSSRPRALYCNPTVHNPTTSTMSRQRRLDIAGLARQYGVQIIEDDPLGSLHPEAPPPIAALAPDVCWCLLTTTKSLAHGLRIAYLVAPSAVALDGFIEPVRGLSHWHPNPIPSALVTEWITSGVAEEISNAICSELLERQSIALSILRSAKIDAPRGAMHMWLHLADAIDRNGFTLQLAQAGVRVRPSDLFAIDSRPAPNAIRLSLSSASDRDALERGARVIERALASF